ncbi:MAG TPA: AraC family transcriptional regulator [Cyanobacteria bacterium UBA8803]|nr:AraC family transcriptional regulator [Cyanobacteria bacterium UBA8803]
MTPLLPQHDPNPDRRQKFLERQREFYKYNHDYLAPLAYADEVPISEAFTAKYQAQQFRAISKILLNLSTAELGNLFDPFDHLDDYEKLFLGEPLLPKPASTKTFLLDTEFARQRIAGPNPLIIERVDYPKLQQLIQQFPVTDALFQQVVHTETTLEGAAKEGRLYLADYAMLEGMQPGRYQHWQKYITAPLALYYWQSTGYSDRGVLVPVAIQLHQKPGPDNPIFTRLDEPNWSIAKTFVQIADFNHHELISHLARTHLTIAPFVLATARQLADNHPLRVLLKPHFQFTLAINELARFELINPGGFVDKIFAGTLKASLSLVVESFQNSEFKDAALPTELKHRGVDEVDVLPDYPYRDDAYLLWEAIHQFATDYLSLYYKAASDVFNDYELQRWAKDVTAWDGGRVKGLTADGKLDTLEELVNIVTQIIFTCGPQHAAVNYPQYDYEAFTPNMPAAGYALPPKTKETAQLEIDNAEFFKFVSPHLLKFLPPKQQAVSQLQLTYFLTAFQYNRLGYYDRRDFQDPRVAPIINSFQRNLHLIEDRINIRNAKRSQPYVFLKPSLIPNSINI